MTQRHSTRGAWLIILASLIAMAICVYDYYTPDTGLIGTGGVILVAVAALLMLLASLVVATVPNRPCLLQGFLVVVHPPGHHRFVPSPAISWKAR